MIQSKSFQPVLLQTPLPANIFNIVESNSQRIDNQLVEAMPSLPPFHLAFPVRDLEATRDFYTRILECRTGRSSDNWIDFELYGHQIVAHLTTDITTPTANTVDEHDVPVPHFGVILDWDTWHALAERLKQSGMEFVIEPYIRFAGEIGEQATMFFLDPSGNALEFKAFRDPAQIFAS